MEEQKVTVRTGRPDARRSAPARWRSWRVARPWCSYGGTVVLVAASAAKTAEAGPRLRAPHRGLPRAHVRRGQDPGRLLQARGTADREGNAQLAPHRPARSARCSPKQFPYETQIMATVRLLGPGERRRRAGADRRLGGAHALRHSVPRADRRRARGPRRRRSSSSTRRSRSSTRATWTSWWRARRTTSSWSRAARARFREADLIAGAASSRWRTSADRARAQQRPDRARRGKAEAPAARRRRTPTELRVGAGFGLRRAASAQAIRIPGKEARQEELDTHRPPTRSTALTERFAEQAALHRQAPARHRARRAARHGAHATACAPTAARPTRSARSRSRSACCRARTVRACSRAARRRRWR